METTDPAYLKQCYDGKPVIEVLFAGQQEQRPAVFTRGAILEDGILKPEAISVPSERIHVLPESTVISKLTCEAIPSGKTKEM